MEHPIFPASQPILTQEIVQNIWGTVRQPAGCLHCQQAFLVDASRLGQTCPNCGKGNITSQPALLRNEPPELTITFKKSRQDLLNILTQFTKGVWLHNNDFNPNIMSNRAVPIFWPMWLVDSQVNGDWKSEIGYDYQVKSSQEIFRDNRWQTHEVIETRIRWEPRLGKLSRHYSNIPGPALTEHNKLIALIGNYQLDQVTSYESTQLGKADLIVPDLIPESAWSLVQANLNQAISIECMKASNGQQIRNYSINANYDNLNWSQLLLPLWVTFYTDDGGNNQMVYINGQNGKTGGVRLASQRKGWQTAGIMAVVGLILVLASMLCFAIGTVFPPLMVLGTLLIIFGFGVGLSAIVPAVWPWQWNRKQR